MDGTKSLLASRLVEVAAVEGVDEHRRQALVVQQEVTRHADAREVEPEPVTELDADDGERDRNAQPAPHDIVEEGVARIVVVDGVARERELAEQAVVPLVEVARRAPGGEVVERRQLVVDVEVGVRVGRDQEGGARERDGLVGALDELDERGRRVHGRQANGGRPPTIGRRPGLGGEREATG